MFSSSSLEDDNGALDESSRFTIVVDSREKKPYRFERFDVDVERRHLDTGDYTIKGYESQFAVERKAQNDFVHCVGPDHKRFRNQVKRADIFDYPMAVVVEAPWWYFDGGHYYQNVHVNAIRGTVKSWKQFNIEWHFEDNRSAGERKTYELLSSWVKKCSSE